MRSSGIGLSKAAKQKKQAVHFLQQFYIIFMFSSPAHLSYRFGRAVTMGVPVGRFPGGAGQKRVPKGKKGAVRRLFLKNAIRKGAGQAFSLRRWAPRDGPALTEYLNYFSLSKHFL